MEFNLRRYCDYAFVSISADNTTIDLGTLDRNEAQKLLDEMRGGVEMLEWFLQVTEK